MLKLKKKKKLELLLKMGKVKYLAARLVLGGSLVFSLTQLNNEARAPIIERRMVSPQIPQSLQDENFDTLRQYHEKLDEWYNLLKKYDNLLKERDSLGDGLENELTEEKPGNFV